MKVYLIYSQEIDESNVWEIWDTEEKANTRCAELNTKKDKCFVEGFFVDEQEVLT
jgi:hypothetical protein